MSQPSDHAPDPTVAAADSATAETAPAQPAPGRIPKVPFWAQILLGLVLGVVLGWVTRSGDVAWLGTALTKTGEIFVQLLKLAVAPLVFFAIMISITNLRNVHNAARLATRTLLWFMATSLIAVAIGLVIGLLTNPGSGTGLTADRTRRSRRRQGPGWTSSPASSPPTSSRRSPS